MIEERSFREIIDAGLRISFREFKVLLPVAVFYVGLPSIVDQIVFGYADESTWFSPQLFLSSLFTGIPGFLGSFAISLHLWRLAKGSSLSPAETVLAPWRSSTALPSAIVFSLVVSTGLGLAVLPGIIASFLLLLVAPVAAVEGLGPWHLLKRSYTLLSAHRLRGTAIVFVLALPVMVLMSGLLLWSPEHSVAYVIGVAAINVVILVVLDCAIFLLYADIRCRKESFDLVVLAAFVKDNTT